MLRDEAERYNFAEGNDTEQTSWEAIEHVSH